MENNLVEFALTLHKEKKLDEAKSIYKQILASEPKNYNILNLLGALECSLNNPKDAIKLIKKAISLNSNNANFYLNLGVANNLAGFEEMAVLNYKKAISINPKFKQAHFNLGNFFFNKRDFVSALKYFNTALTIDSNDYEIYNNRGNAFKELNNFENALVDYQSSISLNSNFAPSYYNLGNLYVSLKKWEEALFYFDKTINLEKNFLQAYNNKGNVFLELGDYKSAVQNFDLILKLDSNHVEAWMGKSAALKKLKLFEDSVTALEKAFEINPNRNYLLGELIFFYLKLSKWTKYSQYTSLFQESIAKRKLISKPFASLSVIPDAASQFKLTNQYVLNEHSSVSPSFLSKDKKILNKKITLGYFSMDFRDHAVSYLIKGVLENHNRHEFNLIAFSFKKNPKGEMYEYLSKIFDSFIDVSSMTDDDVVLLSRKMNIDIAIDLNVHTAGGRVDIFQKKAAPIQVNYLGYPGTSGANFYDYIIADKILIPENHLHHYSERIVYLPDSYQANDNKKTISTKKFLKSDFGLPENSFVYCCFCNAYKINPDVANIWAKILKEVPNSVLWLLEDNNISSDNLLKELGNRGVEKSRIVFAKRIKLQEHLSRHSLADLFLDTFPYNAHTTASDSLWSGLPVLTYQGDSFASRVSSSLLSAIELPELIAKNQAEYFSLAVALGKDTLKMKSLKDKLIKNIVNTNLFNTPLFTKNLEKSFQKMIDNFNSGTNDKNINIS